MSGGGRRPVIKPFIDKDLMETLSPLPQVASLFSFLSSQLQSWRASSSISKDSLAGDYVS